MKISGVLTLSSFAPAPRPFALALQPCSPRIAASISHQHRPYQQQQPTPACSKNAAWEVFGKQVSGEWDGYGAEFSNNGKPRELPAAVVPDAFREWEVQLYDWQTQCPTVANENLHYKLIRLLPTVGCEADAATQYSIDDRWVGDSDSGGKFLAFHVCGSYVAVWPGKRVLRENLEIRSASKSYVWEEDKQVSFEIEHCLVQDGQPKFRVRILHQIEIDTSMEQHSKKKIPVLKSITVQREKWESEFKNGEVLGGCSTSGSAFATTQTLQSSELSGVWQCEIFSAEFEPLYPGIQQLVHTGSNIETRNIPENVLPLPKGMWSKLIELEDGHFLSAAGWLVEADAAVSSNFEFCNSGKAKRAWMKFERKKGW